MSPGTTGRMLPFVLVGGAVGGVLRHAADVLGPASVFPWSTLAVNLVGSMLLALLPALAAVRSRPWAAALLGPGVLGGFTTLSAFSEQTRVLVALDRTALAATYVVASVGACLLGVLLVRGLTSPGERDTFRAEEGDQ